MKKGIHPKYYPEARIVCACGNTIIVGSTRPEMKVEVCSACHPFYTGKKKLLDSTGQVERFKKRFEKTAQLIAEAKKKKAKKGKSEAIKAQKQKKKSSKKKPAGKKTKS